MQQGYEWCLLSFNVGLDIAGVYVFPAFGDVIGMNEILGCQIFAFFCTFRARFSSFQEQKFPTNVARKDMPVIVVISLCSLT